MDSIDVSILLQGIHCFNDYNVDPFLWTVFFKIDGDTASIAFVDGDFRLQGTATVVGRPSNQGNLNHNGVSSGDDVWIPLVVGEFHTQFKPINSTVPGAIGCIAILFKNNQTPDYAIAAGYRALVDGLQNSLNNLIPTLTMAKQEPSEQDIQAITQRIESAVRDAIRHAQDWTDFWRSQDVEVGHAVFRFSQKQLVAAGPAGIELSYQWQGDLVTAGGIPTGPSHWGITGRIFPTDQFFGVAATSRGENRLSCFTRGKSGNVWHTSWYGQWSGWDNLGGPIIGAPAASRWRSDRIDLFGRGVDNQLLHNSFDGNGWTGWVPRGGILTSAPAAISSWDPNRLDCFVRGQNGHMWHLFGDRNGSWAQEDLGGDIVGAPAAVSWGGNRIDCFAHGLDNQLWHNSFDGNGWTGWIRRGGILTSAPAAISPWDPNRLDCFVRGQNGHMWHLFGDRNGSWAQEDLGGEIVDAPAAVSWGNNRIDCFAHGLDNQLWHKWYDGQWGPSRTNWEPRGGPPE